MTPLQEITKIKQNLAKVADTRAKKEGALAERMADLRVLCGTTDLPEADKMLSDLREKFHKEEEKLSNSLANFKEEYADLF